MEKYISRTIIIAVILCSVCFLTYKFYGVTNVEDTSTKNIKQNNDMLSMMIETSAGSGKYEMTTSSSWPTEDYVFNSELSKCENGSTLSWDDANKKVVFEGNNIDKCYVYFDVYSPPKVLSDVCNGGETLLSCIIYLSNKSESTLTNIFYHDSTLANGAEDNSYRYAGASTDVKNYICLGSSKESCPDESLYRIIGVFGDNNHGIKNQQLVKVIKNTTIGDLAWHTSQNNDWSNASLNTILNSTFITEKLFGIQDKVVEVFWRVSGQDNSAVTAKTFYTAEITNTTKTHAAKIGLMYASDYGFATTSDYWTKKVSVYNSEAREKDWLYFESIDWLLSPTSGSSFGAWRIYDGGRVGWDYVDNTYAVRPSFYLNQSVQYISGSGTLSDPIRIN